jgi:hypothetical protein
MSGCRYVRIVQNNLNYANQRSGVKGPPAVVGMGHRLGSASETVDRGAVRAASHPIERS